MKKSDLIDDISARTGAFKSTVEEVLNAIAASAKDHLTNGIPFEIPGIVKMKVVAKAERNGRNPSTGETIRIPAKNVVKATVAAPIRTV